MKYKKMIYLIISNNKKLNPIQFNKKKPIK